jgi:hypothetical protein
MRRITRTEYLKAQRIVSAYEKQQRQGVYQFLYWLEDGIDDEDAVCEMLVKAKSIEGACEIFLKKKSSDVVKVDYEVAFNREFFDITNVKGFENLI